MLFSSIYFLWVFLPTVLVVNFILESVRLKRKDRIRLKNLFLLTASLVFYAWGGFYYLFLMLAVILINYIGGRFMEKTDNKKLILIITIVINISLLFYFKYFNLFISLAEKISKREPGAFGVKEVVLPIGISFYIFQAMSYVIDVYKERANVQRNIISFALYVSLFPQLIAGPIVQYSDIEEDLNERKETIEKTAAGIKRFCYGLGKKVILANTLAEVVDAIWEKSPDTFGAGVAWLGMICYTFQIYYDFSGYSDMAIGIGKMLGFNFKENFNYPYTSLSVTEFWRRWHISLSSWFREYVYIPLGGNRKGKVRTLINIFIVFLLTGIWHGANLTFFFWGIYYAIILIIERLFLGKALNKNRVNILNTIYTMFLVMIGWVFFRSDTLEYANLYISRLFAGGKFNTTVLTFLSMKVIIVLIAAVLFSGIVQRPLKEKYEEIKDKAFVRIPDIVLQILVLAYSIILIISGTYNPFIYFQF
ncbi:MAG: MBOAT family protein [Lachnospiraceae bacterium]|nr:MBOAT family protein [Lachnospiraceae bacterium]